MLFLNPAWPELLGTHSFDWKEPCALFDLSERLVREFLDLQQLLPMSEVAVPLAMASNVIGNVFGDTRKLGQLFWIGGIKVDWLSHDEIFDADIRLAVPSVVFFQSSGSACV